VAKRKPTIGRRKAYAEAGIARLDRLIGDLQQFDPAATKAFISPQVEVLKVRIDDTLSSIFGNGTPRYELYREASDLDQTRYSMGPDVSLDEHTDRLRKGKELAIALLTQARDSLREDIGEAGGPADKFSSPTVTVTPPQPATLAVIVLRGQVELDNLPAGSPFMLNRLREDLPEQLAAVTKAIRDLIKTLETSNDRVVSEMVKAQLIAMLEIALQDLKAPYADTGRLKQTRDFIHKVGAAAVTGAATGILTTQLNNAAEKLGEAIDWIAKLAGS